jgi:hypothetical protein
MPLVATWDYPNRRIVLDPSTMDTDIDLLDVYREERTARKTTEAHRKFPMMTEALGGFDKIPGVSRFPSAVRMRLGARLVPHNASHSLRVIRDVFSDDGLAGRDCFDRTTLSVGAAVDIDMDFPEVEIRLVSTSGGSGSTPAQVADALLQRSLAGGADGGRTVRDALRASRNRVVISGSTLTVYAEDDTTVAWTATITTAQREALQGVDPA